MAALPEAFTSVLDEFLLSIYGLATYFEPTVILGKQETVYFC
jgi:hypothetical protein